jgi:hypothetical protein
VVDRDAGLPQVICQVLGVDRQHLGNGLVDDLLRPDCGQGVGHGRDPCVEVTGRFAGEDGCLPGDATALPSGEGACLDTGVEPGEALQLQGIGDVRATTTGARADDGGELGDAAVGDQRRAVAGERHRGVAPGLGEVEVLHHVQLRPGNGGRELACLGGVHVSLGLPRLGENLRFGGARSSLARTNRQVREDR